jgi:hypothetical protein
MEPWQEPGTQAMMTPINRFLATTLPSIEFILFSSSCYPPIGILVLFNMSALVPVFYFFLDGPLSKTGNDLLLYICTPNRGKAAANEDRAKLLAAKALAA